MSSEKKHENVFKFGIYQNGDTVLERIFSADYFNPVVRYSVDIRDTIPSLISRLQKVLSRRNLTFKIDVGNDMSYDILQNYKKQLRLYEKMIQNKLERPQITTQVINGKTIKGVECKFGLYINDKPIVERNFYVDNYNPASRFSFEVVDVVNEISEEIFESLKISDVNHMWDYYDLIKVYGLYIHQIRELNELMRKKYIINKHNPTFVKRIKDQYRSNRS